MAVTKQVTGAGAEKKKAEWLPSSPVLEIMFEQLAYISEHKPPFPKKCPKGCPDCQRWDVLVFTLLDRFSSKNK